MRWLPILLLLPLSFGCVEYDLTTWDQVDVFHQNPPDSVDILLVVDNSCSMDPYQEKLGENFDQFISFFIDANVDYQIGVVTTDVETSQAGRIRGGIINADTSNASSQFASNVAVGTSGSGYEMGLEAARRALSEPNLSGANAGFLRDEASLSVIFVSDEQDASPDPVNDYINFMYGIKGQRARDVFNGSALAVTNLSECTAQQQAQSTVGTRYIDVARQSGGVIGNICATDFATIVTELSLNSSRMRGTFYLTALPAPATLQVSIDGTEIPCDDGAWTYDIIPHEETGEDRPAVIFQTASIPAPNTKVSIRYDRGNGETDGFCGGE